jgi:hypothetical protein
VEWQADEVVWPDHHDDVSLAQMFDQIIDLETIAFGLMEFHFEQLFAVCRREAVAVPVKVLILARDPVLHLTSRGRP